MSGDRRSQRMTAFGGIRPLRGSRLRLLEYVAERSLRRAENRRSGQGLVRPPALPDGAGPPDQNPLIVDTELFYEFMGLLDRVLDEPEIGRTLTDNNLTRNVIRMKCVAMAETVLKEAPAEYAAYEQALAGYRTALAAYREALAKRRRREDQIAGNRALRASSALLCTTGLIAIVLDFTVGTWWQAIGFLWKPGLAALAVGVAAFGLALIRASEWGIRLGGEVAGDREGDLDRARQVLVDVVRAQHLLPFVRTLINQARRSALDDVFAVTDSPGLSEVYDSAYHVPTEVTAELEGLVDRLAGGSIGLAGPRGSGKSTLVRGYCDGAVSGSSDLRCMVAAPVDYVARDFALHLFATFCRSVRAQLGRWSGPFDELLVATWLDILLDAARNVLFWAAVAAFLFRDWIAGASHQPVWFVVWIAVGVLAYGLAGAVSQGSHVERTHLVAVWGDAALEVLRSVLRWGAAGSALLYFRHGIADRLGRSPHLVVYGAWSVLGLGALAVAHTALRELRYARDQRAVAKRRLIRAARRNLRRVRYLQTTSVGWSGKLKLPMGGEGQRTWGISRAEQPMSYPEIVDEFRRFAADVADFLHDGGGRVFIGVDELDKIGSAEQAERFLNGIKGVFGIPHTYFLISVSDDALTSFERRGLPLRDAFDSSFDEIIRVDPLTYTESRRLVYRRVIGLTEPYIAFCHCLSGGLARDLIRAARQVVRVGQQGREVPGFGEICGNVLSEEVARKLNAATQVIASAEASEKAGPLLERIFTITHRPARVVPTIELVEEVRSVAPAEPARLVAFHQELVAYLYLCATLQEIFGQRVEESRLLWATADGDRHPGHLDMLATARLGLGHSARVAWRLVDDLRGAWSLARLEDA